METPENDECRKSKYQKVAFEHKFLSLSKSKMDKFISLCFISSLSACLLTFASKKNILFHELQYIIG
jgi:hypothetical protein